MGKRRQKKEYSQAARLQDLVRTLMARRAGVTIEELVELYGVTRRTIYRDLDALAASGYPLYAVETGSHKLWRLHDRFTQVPPLTLSTSELISLYLTKTQIGYLEGTPFAQDMDNIFGKLEKTLSPKLQEQLSLFARKFYFIPDAPKSYARHLDLLYDVMDALIRQKVCTMTYHTPRKKEATRRKVEPLTLVTHKQGLYLLAREAGMDKVLTFAVDRIVSFDETEDTFEYPADYSPQKQTEGAFGIVAGDGKHKVQIHITPRVAHLVTERRFHPTQKIRQNKDGSLLLEMTLSALGDEIVSFVLSHGPDAEVMAPVELRQQVAARHKEAAAQYR